MNTIDQTGYGFSSGGFAPTAADSAQARQMKHEMDRMSDFMQKLDPVLRRTTETLIRTQVRNGASPEEARRAAFGSAQGQMLSDGLLGLRRTGFLGHGDPINYGRNILQGVSGGGFAVNVESSGALGRNQSVMGGGLLSGTASMQMARDVMTNMYGKDNASPSRNYGFNMEEASGVFRKMAERGALGNIGTLKSYGAEKGSPVAINDKIENARRQEVDPEILKALEGTNAENIKGRMEEALKRGDKQIATALSDIQTADSTLVLDDKNTKRVSDITKETLKGLANLKDVYGELNSPQLLAKMEALTGISISNKAEARKASNMTQSIINTATATGNDPRGVMEMMMMQQGELQARLAAQFGQAMGQGGASGGIGKQFAGSMNKAITDYALTAEAAARGNSTGALNQFGVTLTDISKEDMVADTREQILEWTSQNKNIAMMSGQAESTLKGDADFQRKSRSIMERALRSKDPEERAALEDEAMQLNMSRNNGKGAAEMLETAQGQAAMANANMRQIGQISGANSAMAVQNDRSDQIILDVVNSGGLAESNSKVVSEAFKRMGLSGMSKLAYEDGAKKGQMKSEAERKAELDKMIKNKTLSEAEASAMMDYTSSVTDAQYAGNVGSVGSSSARGQSYHDTQIARAEAESRTNNQQRELYSNDKELSLKKMANAILTGPDKGGLNTPTQQLYALEAMQKAGLAHNLKPATKINWDDGLSQKEMDSLRATAGEGGLSLHERFNFDSEEAMLKATEGEGGANLRRDIQDALAEDTRMFSGGTSDRMHYLNNDQAEAVRDQASRFKDAVKFGQLQGVETSDDASSWTEAQKEIMRTGTVSKGGLGIDLEVDSKQSVYDNDGDTSSWWHFNWNDEKNNPENKAHFRQAGKFSGLASRINSAEEGEDMIRQNNLSGGALLEGLESQLSVMKKAQADGASIVDTTVDGEKTRLDMDTTIKNLTDAIAKLKADDGKGTTTKEMTVEVMVVKRQENK